MLMIATTPEVVPMIPAVTTTLPKDGDEVLVFVYGSLKRGFYNHWLMEKINAKFVGADILFGCRLYNLGAFPGLRKDGDETSLPVLGEVYAVATHQVRQLDAFEGHPGFYRREEMETGSEEMVNVYVYQGKVKEEALVVDGVWREERR